MKSLFIARISSGLKNGLICAASQHSTNVLQHQTNFLQYLTIGRQTLSLQCHNHLNKQTCVGRGGLKALAKLQPNHFNYCVHSKKIHTENETTEQNEYKIELAERSLENSSYVSNCSVIK